MKYFIDTEFIEAFHKPMFGKKRHFIDLISIGIVAEDGRTYCAISNEFNPNDADEWVVDNVILKLRTDWVMSYSGDQRNRILDRIQGNGSFNSVRMMQKEIGKSNNQIAEEVFQFCTNDSLTIEKAKHYNVVKEGIEFYGYYADYDWVLFCSLFGRMIDLPKGFPMYCRDLKQMLDERFSDEPDMKQHPGYPKQENEHNALSDAKWNKKLYDFIMFF